MKSYLFFKTKNSPSISSLRPSIFSLEKYWLFSLILFLLFFIILSLVGFKLFRSVYLQDYKKSSANEVGSNILNLNDLYGFVDGRKKFVDEKNAIPPDPSV